MRVLIMAVTTAWLIGASLFAFGHAQTKPLLSSNTGVLNFECSPDGKTLSITTTRP